MKRLLPVLLIWLAACGPGSTDIEVWAPVAWAPLPPPPQRRPRVLKPPPPAANDDLSSEIEDISRQVRRLMNHVDEQGKSGAAPRATAAPAAGRP